MATNKSFNPSTSLLNLTEENNFPKKITIDCEEMILNSLNYNTTKIKRFNHVLDSIRKLSNPQPNDYAKGMLSVLDKEDLDYYKLKTFALIVLIKTE
ncbi:hypothetical protein SAMN04487906_0005 [Zhouia amylolytica]|uniref:Uncharacterized protein n=1 Tax=Zhouia amylolytica TaxID=376730 RepID=A0A1I6NXP9_9FLAO|nr:hypothetical protein [Zhouia amylolytica]MCQ0112473.1 hypothetical protein [Zhouia amylolytica]SFS32733.1 hypothetical protein SAMN04487906_0005 [Zhouia amylolytica]